ncbi:MAG TPA: ABC transporter ATP-binding protein [Anaerolineaceae bacterium]|nr:ABC transporter ATP-binding protein [Anaerolineaceae bacterium]
MSNTVISVENLSKAYRLGQIGTGTLSNDLKVWWARQRGLPNPMLKIGQIDHGNRDGEILWALKDVNLTVEQGEVLGIIGRNGAGKSTLLKILSRVTAPTSGCVKVKGRIASLLEVGTGFHPELTGKENIYLNGAILGMSKEEVRRKFDEIVAFAEVEKFINTPVKRFSSGMYVRLAFAVAAHLDPEVLLVDEVLAVGDAEFQKKSLGKMGDIAGQGRTVLFVSHNMNSIERLCKSIILLKSGKVIVASDDVSEVVKSYLVGDRSDQQASFWAFDHENYDNPWFTPQKIFICDSNGEIKDPPINNDDPDVWLQLEGTIQQPDPSLTIGCAVYSENGEPLFWSYQTDQPEEKWPKLKIGKNILRCNLPPHLLNEGTYRVEFLGSLHFRQWLFKPGKINPSIVIDIRGGLSSSPLWTAKRPGLLAPIIEWHAIP